jgi:hypothetical protein
MMMYALAGVQAALVAARTWASSVAMLSVDPVLGASPSSSLRLAELRHSAMK